MESPAQASEVTCHFDRREKSFSPQHTVLGTDTHSDYREQRASICLSWILLKSSRASTAPTTAIAMSDCVSHM